MTKKIFAMSQPQRIIDKTRQGMEKQNVWVRKGSIIRQMRKESGITVKQMAMHLKVSPGRLYRFESGRLVKEARLLEAAYLIVLRDVEVKVLLTELSTSIKKYKERGEER